MDFRKTINMIIIVNYYCDLMVGIRGMFDIMDRSQELSMLSNRATRKTWRGYVIVDTPPPRFSPRKRVKILMNPLVAAGFSRYRIIAGDMTNCREHFRP